MSHPFYLDFDLESWARLRASTPLTLAEEDIARLRGINDGLDMEMVEKAYLPLSRLLNLHVQARQQLAVVPDLFLGTPASPVPFIIGVAGSVAVGKSPTSRALQALPARWPHHPSAERLPTDRVLHPTPVLQERGLMERKGFPESYDRALLLDFVSRAKAGEAELEVPVYSHVRYDIVPGEHRVIARPDILIV